ncbi:MAG TPA: aldolase catalytic domain-containing protein [Bacteroidales bacterium]|nr:aldolase catalytic domain-containing protein [Bacteroidales bacterium]HRZ48691.1 aldolase catalytic domain-containing protein [Bacteroidales bacterium]
MNKLPFEILDCTLRDGGYYTQWDFSDQLVNTYMEAMQHMPVGILEIGYRSLPQKEYFGKYFYLPEYVIEELGPLAGSKEMSLMFNEKDVRPKDLSTLLKGLKPWVKLIRLAVDPNNFDRSVILAEAIREQGFDVAMNLMYMSKFVNDTTFLAKLNRLNGLARYLNLVDSYGGMLPAQVTELTHKVKSNCDVTVGFHGHNNLELAFANTLAALEAGCGIVDSTILGMGRGAGNLKTELLLAFLASQGQAEFNFNKLSTLVEAWLPMYNQHEWGTNLPYMVSGANSLPQKDVMEWVSQRFYSINSIIRALHYQKEGDAAEQPLPVFKAEATYKNIIIIGGGPNSVVHASAIKQFTESLDNVCIIHASAKNAKSYEELSIPQHFCLVGNEGYRLESVFNNLSNFNGKCILPPSPRKMGTYFPDVIKDLVFELEKVDFTDRYQDSHTALALQIALIKKAENVYIAGYDGYSSGSITQREQGLFNENEYTFSKIKGLVNIFSLTPTFYSLPLKSVYSLLI